MLNLLNDTFTFINDSQHLKQQILSPDVFILKKIFAIIFFYCSRTMGDPGSAVAYFEESVEFLSKLPTDNQEVISTALTKYYSM